MCGYCLLQHLDWCSKLFDMDQQRYFTPLLPPCPATLVLPPPTHQQGIFLSIEKVQVIEGNTRVYQKDFHEQLSVILRAHPAPRDFTQQLWGALMPCGVAAARAYPQRVCPMPAWLQFPDPDPLPMDQPPGPSLAPEKCGRPGAGSAPWLGRQDRPLWGAPMSPGSPVPASYAPYAGRKGDTVVCFSTCTGTVTFAGFNV